MLFALAIVIIAMIVGAVYIDTASSLLLGLAKLFGISSAPFNVLPCGALINKQITKGQVVSVAFCDAEERHVAVFHPGGDDFSWPCTSKLFDLCVNASNSTEAVNYLT